MNNLIRKIKIKKINTNKYKNLVNLRIFYNRSIITKLLYLPISTNYFISKIIKKSFFYYLYLTKINFNYQLYNGNGLSDVIYDCDNNGDFKHINKKLFNHSIMVEDMFDIHDIETIFSCYDLNYNNDTIINDSDDIIIE